MIKLREALGDGTREVRRALHKLAVRQGPKEHHDAKSVHGETVPGDFSLSSVRRHLETIHKADPKSYTKHESGAGRARFTGYRYAGGDKK